MFPRSQELLLQASEQFDKSNNMIEMTETESTSSSATFEDQELLIHVVGQDTLNPVWFGLKQGAHQQTKSIQMSFHLQDPHKRISKMKHLEDVFSAIGDLPHLEEICFHNADLLVTNLSKLLKKSSLEVLKFHNCTLIAKDMDKHNMDKLWNGIQLQRNLTTLEILGCHYTTSDTLCRNRTKFTYEMPTFLQKQQLPNLQRLVLDECILDNEEQESFARLLGENTVLRELEIRPAFMTSNVERRQQYQVKKQAIRNFMTEVVPDCLAINATLRKLVISIEDYHLEKVYVDAMSCWIDLVQYDNCTLRELRATHLPLSEQSTEQEWYVKEGEEDEELFEYAESYLHHNLKSILRLNQMFRARQRQEQAQECSMKMMKESQQQLDTSVAKTECMSDSSESSFLVRGSEDVTEVWV